jgi:hypothetical protein
MAVFGANGRVQTPDCEQANFELRHGFDFSAGTYRLQAVLSTLSGRQEEAVDIRLVDLSSDQEPEYFRSTVLALTKQVEVLGRDQTLKRLLTP